MARQIEFASYIVERLSRCGVRYFFGVPGDYNLEFLDYIEHGNHVEWVGNANELNAAYAADGYARLTGSLAVVVTTFGVGELSALCGIAGSFAERVPVLHIVGTPSSKQQEENSLLHHTLNTPSSFETFAKMSAALSCSQVMLCTNESASEAGLTQAFDKVLEAVLVQCRPGYVGLPTDTIHKLVSMEGLEKAMPHPHAPPPPNRFPSNSDVQALYPTLDRMAARGDNLGDDLNSFLVAEINQRYLAAQRPILLVDACAARFGMRGVIRQLVEVCGIKNFDTPMGKSVLDGHQVSYGGCYAGANSARIVQEEVERADFVLYVGALKSDYNSGSFTSKIDPKVTVELHSFRTRIGYATYPTADLREILPLIVHAFKLVASNNSTKLHLTESLEDKQRSGRIRRIPNKAEGTQIRHEWFWPKMGEWFCDKDIIITETGTSSFGLTNVILPSQATYVTQLLWASIGWSVGACLGSALAAQQSKDERRVILFVGDGSLQLTVQEIGTMLKWGLCPYIFLINNEGYEIERQIHGRQAKYNEIQPYDHQMLLPFLAGKSCQSPHQSLEIHTPSDLTRLLADPTFGWPNKLRLIEVHMPSGDAPLELKQQVKLTAET